MQRDRLEWLLAALGSRAVLALPCGERPGAGLALGTSIAGGTGRLCFAWKAKGEPTTTPLSLLARGERTLEKSVTAQAVELRLGLPDISGRAFG